MAVGEVGAEAPEEAEEEVTEHRQLVLVGAKAAGEQHERPAVQRWAGE